VQDEVFIVPENLDWIKDIILGFAEYAMLMSDDVKYSTEKTHKEVSAPSHISSP
jgi:hypothetical protein